jgi:quercetin dioxygenase-like cupin family protein
VETGKTQPSVSTLYAMVSHLGVSMDELLGVGPTQPATPGTPPLLFGHSGAVLPAVQRAGENPVLEMENGVRWERLAVGEGGPADALLVTYEPGATSSIENKLMRHSGVEYAYLLEGELTLQLDFDIHVLGPGDSLQFDSVRPHLYSNRGTSVARGIWFVVGRRQHNQAMPAPAGTVVAERPQNESGLTSAVEVLQAMDRL